MKIKAMVAKVDQGQGTMVVVTEDRQFKRMSLPAEIPALGSTIEVSLPPQKQQILKKFNRVRWLATAAVLLLVLTVGLLNVDVSPVAAYVTLDMKPSVQLSLDQKGKIISTKALNSSGGKVLQQVDLKQKDVYQAVHDIVQTAGNEGYFDPKKENLVMASVALVSDKSNVQVENEKLRNIIRDQMRARHYTGYVVVSQAEKAQWEAAQKAGYTVNHMLLSTKASEQGVHLKPEAIDHDHVMQEMEQAHISIPKLFPKDSCRVTWQQPAGTKQGKMAPVTENPLKTPNSSHEPGHSNDQQAPTQMPNSEMAHSTQQQMPYGQGSMSPTRQPDYSTGSTSPNQHGEEWSGEMPESGMDRAGSGMHR